MIEVLIAMAILGIAVLSIQFGPTRGECCGTTQWSRGCLVV